MKVYLYSEMQKMIEKSGVGRALYHQQSAAKQNNIGIARGLEDADIVHINTVFPGSLRIAERAKKKGIPVVFHAHSTKEDFRNSYIGANLFAPLFGKWIRYCYNKGTMIITPTEYSKKLLQSYGIDKRIEAVSNGVDLMFFDRNKVRRESFRKRYGYSMDQKIIMSVGLTIERKGVSDFVELAKRMPEYQFIWFGETNLNTIPARTRKAVCTKLPNLRFAGYAKPGELRDAYGSCDLFLFPSKEETEGIVVLEALAMKIPILLRQIPVYEDWLTDNKDVYKAGNPDGFELMTKRIINGELPDLTEAGYRVAEERSIEKVGKKLSRIYRECLEKEQGFSPDCVPEIS